MTNNQIAYKQAQEAERSNKSREAETNRSNVAKEAETKRHNRRSENIDIFGHIAKGVGGLGKGLGSIIGGAINDPAWYNKDPQLVKDVASISYHNPLGNSFKNELGTGVFNPGIVVLPFIPTIGNNGNPSIHNNAANITAKNVYAYVRYANSGSRNYDAPDLMLYLLAMDQIYSFWGMLRRIYSLALTYKAENRYYEKAMLAALGVDPDDVRAHLADLRAFINTFAMRANSFYVPRTMTYYDRHIWLNTSIFKDMGVKKSQEYVFLQECFLQYDDVNGKLCTAITEPGGFVSTSPVFKPGGNFSVNQLVATGNTLLTRLANSEDIGIMSGDILKAYGEASLFFLPTTEENLHIESVYSLEVLSQIQAATLTQYLDDTNAILAGYFDICQDPLDGAIYQGHAYYNAATDTSPAGYGIPCYLGWGSRDSSNRTAAQSVAVPAVTNTHTVNMYKDDVTPDDTMVATRLIVNVSEGTKHLTNVSTDTDYNKPALIITGCGSEVINSAQLVTFDMNGDLQVPQYIYGTLNYESSMSALLYRIALSTKFDWFPIHFYSSNGTGVNKNYYFLDSANYTTIPADNINSMHYVACLSMFGVPLLGTKVRTR